MKFYIISFLASVLVFGCKDISTENSDYTYFGGEIINPKNNHVTLYSPETGYDTLFLDKQNRFLKKLETFKPGLFSFMHGGEYQLVLLEPSDSIMLRLNTIDFDESLVFTGLGSKKNNYLIKTFLENEIEIKKRNTFCRMSPEELESYLDSTKKIKLEELNSFLDKKPFSDLFKSIAEANIDYNYYYYKEIYPFGYYGNHQLAHYKDLPQDFYDYRKEIDYGLDHLSEYPTYNQFMLAHFNNLALTDYYDNVADYHETFDRQSLDYNLEKLRLIDSLVTSEKVKNYLLKINTREFVYNSTDTNEASLVLNSYFEKTTNEKDKKDIDRLLAVLNNLRPGKDLPNAELLDFNGEAVMLNNLISKPTVIYFWSSNNDLIFKNSHYRTKRLKAKFPQVEFIAININNDDKKHWKSTLQNSKFPTQNEYQFKDKSTSNILAINSIYTVILVDDDGKIVTSRGSLFNKDFENEIQTLISR